MVRVVRISTTISSETAEIFDKWNKENPNDRLKWSEALRKGFYFLIWEKTHADVPELFDELPLQVRHKIQHLTGKLQEAYKEIEKMTGGLKNG